MKILAMIYFLSSISLSANAFSDSMETIYLENDSLIYNAEDKIKRGYIESIRARSTMPLQTILEGFESLKETLNNNIVDYWIAYNHYYSSLAHLALKDKKKSEKEVANAIEVLRQTEKKSSEHYALLCLLQGYQIQFRTGMEAGMLSQKASLNGEKAIELDDENLRAYYSLANLDFYTPEIYGGGKKAEGLLLKAVDLKLLVS